MENFLLQSFVFLAAAIIAVPVAKKLGLGGQCGGEVDWEMERVTISKQRKCERQTLRKRYVCEVKIFEVEWNVMFCGGGNI